MHDKVKLIKMLFFSPFSGAWREIYAHSDTIHNVKILGSKRSPLDITYITMQLYFMTIKKA